MSLRYLRQALPVTSCNIVYLLRNRGASLLGVECLAAMDCRVCVPMGSTCHELQYRVFLPDLWRVSATRGVPQLPWAVGTVHPFISKQDTCSGSIACCLLASSALFLS